MNGFRQFDYPNRHPTHAIAIRHSGFPDPRPHTGRRQFTLGGSVLLPASQHRFIFGVLPQRHVLMLPAFSFRYFWKISGIGARVAQLLASYLNDALPIDVDA